MPQTGDVSTYLPGPREKRGLMLCGPQQKVLHGCPVAGARISYDGTQSHNSAQRPPVLPGPLHCLHLAFSSTAWQNPTSQPGFWT